MSKSNYKAYKELIKQIQLNAANTTEQGKAFETLVKIILERSPFFNKEVKEVYFWNEFEYRTTADRGIDLVVKTNNDEYWAIQCKCFSPNTSIRKEHLNDFNTAILYGFYINNIHYGFSRQLFFHTSEGNLSNNIQGENVFINDNKTIRTEFFSPSTIEQFEIDWTSFTYNDLVNNKLNNIKINSPKNLEPHQNNALNDVIKGLKEQDRGKLIMPCGTGKTFTSLKIVEKYIRDNNIENAKILYLVPSIALLSQTIIEWTCQCSLDSVNRIGICSDATAGNNKVKKGENDEFVTECLPIPATTDVAKLVINIKENNHKHLFVFSTYQSIDVVSKVQEKANFEFDLIVCDEAHRTASKEKIENDNKSIVDFEGKDISDFVKVHHNKYIRGKKRLYMTATPKLYAENAKKEAKGNGYEIISMDNVEIFGDYFHILTFGQAIDDGLLIDYKLIVMTIDKSVISESLQKLLNEFNKNKKGNEIESSFVAKLVGVMKAISKKCSKTQNISFGDDSNPMKRIVTFSLKKEQAKSYEIAFNALAKFQQQFLIKNDWVIPNAQFISGDDNSNIKEQKLNWLKEDFHNDEYNETRILTNARCLSEGVDVPSLDGIAFVNRRNSNIDIIQAIGRVMRKPRDGTIKKYGYIIVPVVLDSDELKEDTISSHEEFKNVLSICRALRSHDNRLNNDFNTMTPGGTKLPANFVIIDNFVNAEDLDFSGSATVEKDRSVLEEVTPQALEDNAKFWNTLFIKKLGDRLYWDNWATEIKNTVDDVIDKIKAKKKTNDEFKVQFKEFVKGLKKLINPNQSEEDAIVILAQHIIILPILQSIFNSGDLIKKNKVVQLLESINQYLPEINDTLQQEHSFYKDIVEHLEKIQKGKDDDRKHFNRQEVIRTLFDKFIAKATPRDKDKFGIVYTPVEIVDFIINSVSDALKQEFNQSLLDKDVKILDPFTGTGTFITRLFQKFKDLSATKEQIARKYKNDVWCNEMMLLAYYISLINIEDTYNSLTDEFTPFEHDVFADTFQLYEDGRTEEEQIQLFKQEFELLTKVAQNEQNEKIKIIIGNPPYSVGQKIATANNQNNKYEKLRERIFETYVKGVTCTNKQQLYDSYVQAFRWASDRIGKSGIISFISNGGYINGRAFEGFRKELLREFNSIYVYDLLGNVTATILGAKNEGENVFGNGCKTKVCIILLIKNPNKKMDNFIHYKKIGSDLKTKQKLDEIKNFKSLFNINDYEIIYPDKHNNWVDQSNFNFEKFLLLAKKKVKDNILELSIIDEKYSRGLVTSKDLWIYNFDRNYLTLLIKKYLQTYNAKVEEWKNSKSSNFEDFIKNINFNEIKWTQEIFNFIKREINIINNNDYRIVQHRVFTKKYLYFDKKLISGFYKWDKIFPTQETKNKVINITWIGHRGKFECIMSKNIIDLSIMDACQSFPLYWYETNDNSNTNQHSLDISSNKRINTISEEIVKLFQEKYEDTKITHEDIFNYIYGVFHSNDYKTKYANNLKNEIPRIPYLEDFWGYSKIGKELGDLHINYENAKPYDGVEFVIDNKSYKSLKEFPELLKNDFKVMKMKFADDDSTIVFNNKVTIKNIPNEVHNYKFANRSILKWIINEYQYYEDKEFKLDDKPIVNDPNEYDLDKGGRYVFDLILSLITVSLKTQELVKELPKYKELE